MTAPRSTLRTRRRVARAGEIPDELLQWFAGELESPPWTALLPPDYEKLPGRWAEWLRTHPNARIPAGCNPEWLEISTTKGEPS